MHRSLLALLVLVAACGGGPDDGAVPGDAAATAPPAHETAVPVPPEETTTLPALDGCAHVIEGEIAWQGESATVSATVRSADTGWDKYADAWEVRTTEGDVLGVRELAHPHETEQPFTRSLTGVTIPAGVSEVVLAAHDSVVGWCGETLTIPVPDRQ